MSPPRLCRGKNKSNIPVKCKFNCLYVGMSFEKKKCMIVPFLNIIYLAIRAHILLFPLKQLCFILNASAQSAVQKSCKCYTVFLIPFIRLQSY